MNPPNNEILKASRQSNTRPSGQTARQNVARFTQPPAADLTKTVSNPDRVGGDRTAERSNVSDKRKLDEQLAEATPKNNNVSTPQPREAQIVAESIPAKRLDRNEEKGTSQPQQQLQPLIPGDVAEATEEDQPELPPEEKEIAEVKTQYRLTPKFNAWYNLYLDKSNKETYLNQTKAALEAYSLDPKTQYQVAAQIGYKNMKKVEDLCLRIAEERGYTVDKWLDKSWLQMLKSDSPEWWDRIGDQLGFRSLKPAVQINQKTQNNTFVNVTPEQQQSFNDDFKSFVKSR